eukprot:scaffold88801_cov55-Attheya_sp.AAC.7
MNIFNVMYRYIICLIRLYFRLLIQKQWHRNSSENRNLRRRYMFQCVALVLALLVPCLAR